MTLPVTALDAQYPATRLPQTNRRVLVIFNPAAGGGRTRLGEILRQLATFGCAVTLRETAGPGDAACIVRDSAEAYDVVAVAGGDGTINEAANGMNVSSSSPALAIVPCGTANVLAWETGLGNDESRIAQTIAQGQPREIFTGRINGRRFLLMAGAGFDAAVVAGVTSGLKHRLGKLAYVWRMSVELFRYAYPMLTVTIDGTVYQAASVVVAKGHFYGGQFVCAPDARLSWPSFEVCLFLRGGRWNVLRYSLALAVGRLSTLSSFRILRGRHVVIDGPLGAPVQADGELVAALPVTIEVSAERLSLLYPSQDGADGR